jgi:iron complex outermembrane recepter protein
MVRNPIAVAVALALAVPVLGYAQEVEEIVVTGSRIVQAPGMLTPTPVTSLQSDDLRVLAPTNLIDSLSALPQFSGNSSQQNALGGQNSGGSNVNLRGAGINRTLVLLDGRRVVSSNRFGTVDVNSLPEMLLQNVDTVTGGASASYGTDAVAGVVNFRLDTKFEGVKVRLQGGQTTRNDGQNYEAGFAIGHKIGDRLNFVGSIQHFNQDRISGVDGLESRPWYNQTSRVTNPLSNPVAGTGGPSFLIRPYVQPTNFAPTGLIVDNAAGALNRLQFGSNGTTVSPLPFYGVGQRDGGCFCQALPGPGDRGVNIDDEVQVGFRRTNGFARLGFQVSDNVNVFAQGIWSENAANQRRESIALLGTWQGAIFSNNAFLTPDLQQRFFNGPGGVLSADPVTGGTDAVLGSDQVRRLGFGVFLPNNESNPIGDTRQITANAMRNLTIGFDAKISGGWFEGWNANGYLQKGNNRQEFNTINGIRVDRLWFALDAVRDPATALRDGSNNIVPNTGNIVCRAALPQFDTTGVLRGCVPINLFGGVNTITPEAAAWVRDPYKVASQYVEQTVGEVAMSGDLGVGLPAGNISMAFGGSWRKETLNQLTPDPSDEYPALPDGRTFSSLGLMPANLRGLVPQGNTTASPGYSGYPGLRFVGTGYLGDNNSSSVQFSSLRAFGGSITVKEAFTEFQVPVLKDVAFAQSLDANFAARWADYTGSGEIWAWKAGLSWAVNDQVRLRATRSRDVRAANLQERFDQTRGGFTVVDRAQSPAQTVSGATFSGGNPLVNPEKADTTTIGLVLQPAFLDGFQTSIDWYRINVQGAIAQLSAQQLVDGCVVLGDQNLCPFIIRSGNPQTGQIDRIDSLFINLAEQIIEGVDTEISYRRSLELLGGGAESVSLRLFGTWLGQNSFQNRGQALDERIGQIGALGLPRWKATSVLTYNNGPYSGTLIGRYIGGGKLDRFLVESDVPLRNPTTGATIVTVDDNTVGSVFYTDLTLGWRPESIEGLRVFGTINNLLDRAPPLSPAAIGRTGSNEITGLLHDQVGRRFVVGINYQF